MPQKVTLKDIARETGLSESAVSQVLNNRPCRLSEESKERIRATARRLNYRVNQVARSLAMRRSSTIGLIVPDIENPFFSSLAKRLEGCCREAGYGLLITNSDDRSDYDCEQLERLDSRGVDGIVFVPSNEIMDDEGRLMGVLSGLSVPYVMVDRVIEDAACDKVFVDNEWGAHQAVDYLIERGHTRIGCLARTARTQNGRLRLRGYENALAEHGIELRPEWVRECDYHSESGYREVEGLLATGVTAIFSTSDLMTVGVMSRLTELGVRVPEDVSVVSFDRNEASTLFLPGITSVRQDVVQLAARAFELLMDRINGSTREPELYIVSPELVVGTSVAPPARAQEP
ncbi:MAG TPA: LacI family transcriptional regulator [Candidatus Olsenella pullicola]|nr:LacI family transcriptional regulator [Candidatus Olsenella pullicola]